MRTVQDFNTSLDLTISTFSGSEPSDIFVIKCRKIFLVTFN